MYDSLVFSVRGHLPRKLVGQRGGAVQKLQALGVAPQRVVCLAHRGGAWQLIEDGVQVHRAGHLGGPRHEAAAAHLDGALIMELAPRVKVVVDARPTADGGGGLGESYDLGIGLGPG